MEYETDWKTKNFKLYNGAGTSNVGGTTTVINKNDDVRNSPVGTSPRMYDDEMIISKYFGGGGVGSLKMPGGSNSYDGGRESPKKGHEVWLSCKDISEIITTGRMINFESPGGSNYFGGGSVISPKIIELGRTKEVVSPNNYN